MNLHYLISFWAILIAQCAVPVFTQGETQKSSSAALPIECRKIQELFAAFPEPQPGDWQYQQKEKKQTFRQYQLAKPTRVTKQRNVLFIQILGDIAQEQQEIVQKTADYLSLFFNLKVETLPPMSRQVVPFSARRIHPELGVRQLNATYIVSEILAPRLPKNAAGYMAFTAEDLYPGDGWNFCFGLALYRQRVGVWSLARNGDAADPEQKKQVLRRTIRIASHELGHIFSLPHCVLYHCNMNGANSMEEADGTPLEYCPECLAKLKYACPIQFRDRWTKLKEFYQSNGLEEEAQFIDRLLNATSK